MGGRRPPALKGGKKLPPRGKNGEQVFESKETERTCLWSATPFDPIISPLNYKASDKELPLSARRTWSPPQLRTRFPVCVSLASDAFPLGTAVHCPPRPAPLVVSKANAVSWRSLALTWVIILSVLANAPGARTVSSASGADISSSRFDDAAGHQSSDSSGSVLSAALPLMKPQHQHVFHQIQEEGDSPTASSERVSLITVRDDWLPFATASHDAHAAFASLEIAAAAATAGRAAPTPTATALPVARTAAAGGRPVIKAATASQPAAAANSRSPALVESALGAAPERGIAKIVVSAVKGTPRAAEEAREASGVKRSKSPCPLADPQDTADAEKSATIPKAVGGEALADLDHVAARERGSQAEDTEGDTRARDRRDYLAGGGRSSFSLGGFREPDEAQNLAGSVTGSRQSPPGMNSHLSPAGPPSAAGIAAVDKAAAGKARVRAKLTEVEKRTLAPTAVAALALGQKVFHAQRAGLVPAEGRSAAWRRAAAAQKKALEDEGRAEREAAARPSPAEVETVLRKKAASLEEAAQREAALLKETGGDQPINDKCAGEVQQLVNRGMSEAAAQKIKHLLAVERFTQKVAELRKVAARRCLGGEEEACEKPDNPIWEKAGLSKPEDLRPVQRFTAIAKRCPPPKDDGSPTLSGPLAPDEEGSSGAASGRHGKKQQLYLNVLTAEGNGESTAKAPASFLDGSYAYFQSRNHQVDELGKETKAEDPRSPAATTAKEDRGQKALPSLAEEDDVFAEVPSSVQPGEDGVEIRSGESLSRSESRKSTRRSSGRDSDSRGGKGNKAGSGSKSNRHIARTQKTTGRERLSANGRSPQTPGILEDAIADAEEQWEKSPSNKRGGWGKRRTFRNLGRAQLQLRMQPDQRPRTRPVALVQARAQGIFDTLQSLFGNGMDITNPQNFDGGNQGSFFNFMYPSDTDYPWACVCDENQWQRWQNKEIEAVPCRNQIDTSAQGITAACNPLNHQMNATLPRRGGPDFYILSCLSVVVILASTPFGPL